MKETEKWRYFNDVRLLSRIIRTNLESKDFEKLEDSLDEGFKKLPKTKYYQKILIDGTLSLVSYFLDKNQQYNSFQLLEKARQSFPTTRRIVRSEVQLLESIFNLYYSEFVSHDLSLLENISKLFLLNYQKGFPQVKLLLDDLVDRIANLKDNVKEGDESKHTFYLEELFLNLYGDLTKDEVVEEFTKIITPEIAKWLTERNNDEEEKEDDVENSEKSES